MYNFITLIAVAVLSFFIGIIMMAIFIGENYGRVNLEKKSLQFQGNSYRIQEIK